MENLTVSHNHVVLPNKKEKCRGISVLGYFDNTFIVINISAIEKVREIVSIASGKEISKVRKSALRRNTRFSQNDLPIYPPDKESHYLMEDNTELK